MLDIHMLRHHVQKGLSSGQLRMLELEELMQDSVREELEEMVGEGMLSQEEAASHQEEMVRRGMVILLFFPDLLTEGTASPALAPCAPADYPEGHQYLQRCQAPGGEHHSPCLCLWCRKGFLVTYRRPTKVPHQLQHCQAPGGGPL